MEEISLKREGLDISNEDLVIVDMVLNHYANILRIIIKSTTPREKVLSLIYCSNVYVKRERFIHWYDPYFVYDDKISDTSANIQTRLRLRHAFKGYKEWEAPVTLL